MTKVDVVCLGETMISFTPAPPGRLTDASLVAMHVAGAESNVAVALARLGHRTAWVSRLGTDPFGDRVMAAIAGEGVEVSLVERSRSHPTGVMFKDASPDGTTVHYYRGGSAASSMGLDVLDHVLDVHADVVHLSGVTAALSPTCRDLVRAITERRPISDAVVTFDVNYRPRLWGNVAEAAAELLRLARAADVVFVGRDEAEALWGTTTVDTVQELLRGVSTVIVKDGARPAWQFGQDDEEWSVPAPRVDVIEAVGAGDAFAAGWIAGHLRGLTPTQRLRLGHVCAAHAMLGAGDHSQPPGAVELAAVLAGSEQAWSNLHISNMSPSSSVA